MARNAVGVVVVSLEARRKIMLEISGKIMKRTMHTRDENTAGLVLGVAWYRPEDWKHLREVSADSEVLEETHAEWLTLAERHIRDLRKTGVNTERVTIDIDALVTWCRGQGRSVDSATRAEFAAEQVRRRYESKVE